MELPHLGVHCTVASCLKLDFLPYECDCCHKIFCKDHRLYEGHNCTESYRKDVQVPVCPLCNQPLSLLKGQDPDVRVNEHIMRDCTEQEKKKLYRNRCSYPGCKKKELVPIVCSLCHQNFCIKHRFDTEHDCPRKASSARPPPRASGSSQSPFSTSSAPSTTSKKKPQSTLLSQIGADLNRERMHRHGSGYSQSQPSQQHNIQSLTPQGMTEDEVMAMALAASMNLEPSHPPPAAATSRSHPSQVSYNEDEELAKAIAASLQESERVSTRSGQKQTNTTYTRRTGSTSSDSCTVF